MKLNNDVWYSTRAGKEKMWNDYYGIDQEYKSTTLKMGVSDSLDSDLRENPEFMELRVKAMYLLPRKKQELLKKLQRLCIIEEMEEYKKFDGNTVILGSRVSLKFDGVEETYTILGSGEGNLENNIISADTLLAKTIVGHKVGEVLELNGMKVEIIGVEKLEL